jgi:DNA-binding PadR family transcriptional regulator
MKHGREQYARSAEGKHGEEHERFGDQRRGHRIFGHGDIRYVILSILSEKPSYGYELIKAIEERLSGAYSPSPGLVYPTLTMLEELGYVSAKSSDDGKKLYSVTTQGQTFLAINKQLLDGIMGRMAHAASLHRRAESPQLVRAIQNLKFTLKLKTEAKALTDEQIRTIAEALDAASHKIEQC